VAKNTALFNVLCNAFHYDVVLVGVSPDVVIEAREKSQVNAETKLSRP
jgi:hypothetical protein